MVAEGHLSYQRKTPLSHISIFFSPSSFPKCPEKINFSIFPSSLVHNQERFHRLSVGQPMANQTVTDGLCDTFNLCLQCRRLPLIGVLQQVRCTARLANANVLRLEVFEDILVRLRELSIFIIFYHSSFHVVCGFWIQWRPSGHCFNIAHIWNNKNNIYIYTSYSDRRGVCWVICFEKHITLKHAETKRGCQFLHPTETK